jgi:hypothetical protein
VGGQKRNPLLLTNDGRVQGGCEVPGLGNGYRGDDSSRSSNHRSGGHRNQTGHQISRNIKTMVECGENANKDIFSSPPLITYWISSNMLDPSV